MQRFKKLNRIDELELSMYEEVSEIPENEGDYETSVKYVRDIRDGKLYIKKEIKNGDESLYQELLEFEEINEKKLLGVPQIISVTDAGNTVYVIEEFINCPTLKKVMESQAVTAETLTLIFREISIILERLHKGKSPITHGSISDANILVNMDAINGNTKEQKVYLVDFNMGQKHLLKADVSKDITSTCNVLKSCMDTMMFKSIIELEGELWDGLMDIAKNGPARYTTDRQMMLELGKLIGKRAPRTVKPKKKNYTLPGFRTKKLWKGAIASLGYLFMIMVAYYMDFDYYGLWNIYERVCVLGGMFSYVAWFANYMGVRDKYKAMTEKSILKKLFGHFIAVVAIFGFWMVMLVGPDLFNLV
ncbi:MAG: protein kinase family protein [Lachnospiraceae bacterium]|nr:protein kinase family protein [Lachnospiraceae bacterium]